MRLGDLEHMVWEDMKYVFPYLNPTVRSTLDEWSEDMVVKHINLFWKRKLNERRDNRLGEEGRIHIRNK